MDKFQVTGGKALRGEISVGGAKNVAMKVIIAGLLTEDTITIHNVPFISSVLGTTRIVEPLGMRVERTDHTLTLSSRGVENYKIPLEYGGLYRTATMVIGPLLHRFGKAVVPNPGGCRLGKRPVDWHMGALQSMGADIVYKDGYYYAETRKLSGARIHFPKNTHTGTETVILAACLAKGETVIENAAQEPEIDDLIRLLNSMGALIKRDGATIQITGVAKLKGTEFTIMPDRNEVVSYAIAGIITNGDVVIHGTQREHLRTFLDALDTVNAGWEPISSTSTRFFWKGKLKSSQIITRPHPGFMTDWQAPWAVLASYAEGISTIHETVFEQRFTYVIELRKMGAKIDFFDPPVDNQQDFYNFNWHNRDEKMHQAIRIQGATRLHEAVVEISDLRAGATLVIAALVAQGTTIIYGVEHIDRGYEAFEAQLTELGAEIVRVKESNL